MSKVRVGLIGTGGFARYRVGNLLKVKDAEIVALSDPSAEQMRLTKEMHPATKDAVEYSDYKEMLDSGTVDAVMIQTPHTQHVDQILDAIERGIHVCCEKPLITTVADAHRVIEARDRKKVVGMVSYQRHFQAEFRKIKEMIESGEAGKVQVVAGLSCQEWKRATAGTWRQIHALSGGGQLNDTGSHFVDILLWVTGLRAEIVTAIGDQRGTEVDIDSSVTIKFGGGAIGSITVIGDSTNWNEDITIMCEKIGFFIRNGKLTVRNVAQDRIVYEELKGGTTPDQHFIDCITKGIVNESPFECGLEVIKLTEAAWKSMAQNGTAVTV